MPAHASAGYVKLKELLDRYNMPYVERQEGNAMVIDIKARNFTQKETRLYEQSRTAG